MAELNKLGKAAKGKMDPIAACPSAKRLVGRRNRDAELHGQEQGMVQHSRADVADGFKQARAKTSGFASQACAVAAKVKKMRDQGEQAASGGGMGAAKVPIRTAVS